MHATQRVDNIRLLVCAAPAIFLPQITTKERVRWGRAEPNMTSKALICALLAVFFGLSASAQQITGSIRGTVVDPSGATVQGASVSATQAETGLTRTIKT